MFLNDYGRHPLEEKLRSAAVPYRKLDGSISALVKLIKTTNKQDTFHTHGYKAGILIRLLSVIYGLHVVSTYHCGDRGTGKLALYTWLDKITQWLSTNIAVSREIQQWLGKKAYVMDNFISPEPMLNKRPSQTTNIAFVGRLSHEKGPDIFTEVARRFLSHYDLSFSVYGDGPLLKSLQNTATQNVSFKGFCSDMRAQWKNIDVLLISSRQEGMPMVAIEAMMRGIPVVAAPCGSLPALLDNDKRGWLANSSSVEDLQATLLLYMLSTSEQRQKTIYRAHHYVTEYCSGREQWQIFKRLYGLSNEAIACPSLSFSGK